MTNSSNSAFHGKKTKRQSKTSRAIFRFAQIGVFYGAGTLGTFAWGFFQGAGAACGNGMQSCAVLAGSLSGEAVVWPLYWGPRLLGMA